MSMANKLWLMIVCAIATSAFTLGHFAGVDSVEIPTCKTCQECSLEYQNLLMECTQEVNLYADRSVDMVCLEEMTYLHSILDEQNDENNECESALHKCKIDLQVGLIAGVLKVHNGR
jgi:transcription elongation factor Elf1